jgi:hypothetical protein
MDDKFANVVAYDSTGYQLYGIVLQFPLSEHSNKLRMEGLHNFLGPRLMLKDGTAIVPDSAGYSNVSFPVNGEVVEICAVAPPAFARQTIHPLKNVQAPHSKPASEHKLFGHCLRPATLRCLSRTSVCVTCKCPTSISGRGHINYKKKSN